MRDDQVIKSWAIAAQSTQPMLFHVPTENMRRIFRHIEALTAELDERVQTSASMCDDCGWAMKFPDCGCVYCGFHRLEKERDARIDPAHVQDLIAAAEPVLAEAYAASEADNTRLRKILKDAQGYLEKGLDKVAFNIIRATLEKDTK